MAGTKFYGSICVSDLIDLAHKKHSAFSKADNGKVYANINVWLNDEKDKFGNIMSLQLNPKKDLKEQDGQPYIGNCKESEAKPISSKDTSGLSLPDDIPNSSRGINSQNEVSDITEPVSDLPF